MISLLLCVVVNKNHTLITACASLIVVGARAYVMCCGIIRVPEEISFSSTETSMIYASICLVFIFATLFNHGGNTL
jgi:hypothetical protein